MARTRVAVVVNKWWECDPVVGVLLHNNARPAELGWPAPLLHPHPQSVQPRPAYRQVAPRAVFHLANVDAEIWCVSDLLEDLDGGRQSSTESKALRLPLIVGEAKPSVVIAVGTAGFSGDGEENGSVVVGSRVFIHDGHPADDPNCFSQWRDGRFDTVLDSSLSKSLFDAIVPAVDSAGRPLSELFLGPPIKPAKGPRILADYDWVSLGTVNVTDPSEYKEKDRCTMSAFGAIKSEHPGMSIETTHGVIRTTVGEPFLFVSGIVNKALAANEEMLPRKYSQNFVGAHNAGVVVAWMLPKIDAALA